MRTEEQIVYDLIEIVSGGVINDDSPYSERLIRSFLRKSRAEKIHTFYKRGYTASDIVFQDLGDVQFTDIGNGNFSASLPAIINMEHNFGVYAEKMGFNIPVLHSWSFEKSKRNFLNGGHPKAKFDHNNLVIFKGIEDNCCNTNEASLLKLVVEEFSKEANVPDDVISITARVRAVLYDPSEAEGYDWTRDPYPCPSEIIDQIETSVKARDLNLMIRVEEDQVTNQKTDNIQFDDTTGVR